MLKNFQLLLTNILQTAVAMGLFIIALWIIHFVDTVLLHKALKKRFGLQPKFSLF